MRYIVLQNSNPKGLEKSCPFFLYLWNIYGIFPYHLFFEIENGIIKSGSFNNDLITNLLFI